MNNTKDGSNHIDSREERSKASNFRGLQQENDGLKNENKELQEQVSGFKQKERDWERERKEWEHKQQGLEALRAQSTNWAIMKKDLDEGLATRERRNEALKKELEDLKNCLDQDAVKKFLQEDSLLNFLSDDIVNALEHSGYNKQDPMSNPPALGNYTNAKFLAGLGDSILVRLLRDIIDKSNIKQHPTTPAKLSDNNIAPDTNKQQQRQEQWHASAIASILQDIDPHFKWQLGILYSLEIRKRAQSATLIDLAPIPGIYDADALRNRKKQYVKKVTTTFSNTTST